MKKLVLIIMMLFFISFVSATTTITSFNDSTSSGNITLFDSLFGSQYKYLSLPTDFFTTSAIIQFGLENESRYGGTLKTQESYGYNAQGISSNTTHYWLINISSNQNDSVHLFKLDGTLISTYQIESNLGLSDLRGFDNNGTHFFIINSSSSKVFVTPLDFSSIINSFNIATQAQDISYGGGYLWTAHGGGFSARRYNLDGTGGTTLPINGMYGVNYNFPYLEFDEGTEIRTMRLDGGSGYGTIALDSQNTLGRGMTRVGDELWIPEAGGQYEIFKYFYNETSITSNSNISIDGQEITSLILGSNFENQTNNFYNLLNTYCEDIVGTCDVPLLFNTTHPSILNYLNIEISNEGFIENSQTFNATTYETQEETFSINITYDSSAWSGITSQLEYDGVNYTGTSTGSDDELVFSKTIDIPSVDTTQNKSFSWYITLTNSTGNFVYQSTINNQTVTKIQFGECSPGETPFINFNTVEATNPFPDLNATFKSSWEIRQVSGGGSVVTNSSFQDLTETNNTWSFCFTQNETNYTVSATIEVDGTNHAKNFHYLTNYTLVNTTTTNVTIYLLNDTLATLTEFEVVDSSQNGLEDAYISIQYYDVGTDTFYTVGMMKTSSQGKDLTYLNWYDSLYKFVIVRDGELIYTSTPYKISETPQSFQINDDYTFDFEKFLNFQYSLIYNELTQNFVLTFIKPSGDVDTGCLLVTKRNQTNDYTICNVCETSSSATLYCNIENAGNGTFIADFYATGSFSWIYNIFVTIGGNEIYELIGNEDGTVMAIIFSGVVMSMFLFSPVLGVIGLLIGVLGSIALGFQPYQTSTFLAIAFLGGFTIWALRK